MSEMSRDEYDSRESSLHFLWNCTLLRFAKFMHCFLFIRKVFTYKTVQN